MHGQLKVVFEQINERQIGISFAVGDREGFQEKATRLDK
jgi:hypothetical protein